MVTAIEKMESPDVSEEDKQRIFAEVLEETRLHQGIIKEIPGVEILRCDVCGCRWMRGISPGSGEDKQVGSRCGYTVWFGEERIGTCDGVLEKYIRER